ncbi:MAG: hypothetical protein ACMG6H_08285, partial [Acidobacteriota bacterium]
EESAFSVDCLKSELLRKVNLMKQSKTSHCLRLLVIAIFAAFAIFAGSVFAEPIVKLDGKGTIALSTSGPSSFELMGTASHLGKYTCYGEVDFGFPDENGMIEGDGIAVIRAANGDLIVGLVTWEIDEDGTGQIAFSWRDYVEFSDGTVVSSTGRFIKSRPAGAVSRFKTISDGTSNIIAILIG